MSTDGFVERHGTELQVAILCCRAVEGEDPLETLRSQSFINYHNLGDVFVQQEGPVRWGMLTWTPMFQVCNTSTALDTEWYRCSICFTFMQVSTSDVGLFGF
jgi:hypothetical protein